MAVTNLKNGSTGKDVEKLQNALKAAGYDVGKTGADGVYGKNTAAAVKQYQKDNGLAVDGIAGKNTQGLLYGTGALAKGGVMSAQILAPNAVNKNNKPEITPVEGGHDAPTTPPEDKVEDKKPADDKGTDKGTGTQESFTYDEFSYNPYAPSDIVNQANAALQEWMNQKPGAYESQWQAMIDEYMNKIMNREEFSYNFNEDALYQQYKDIYTQQGLMAMMDTMGQASAMTGGYGNSFAQTVGQQAYNQQLNQLNNVLPELYQMAFDRYAYEGEQMMNEYGMLLDRENTDYNRYQNNLDNWYTQLQYLTDRYDTERGFDLDQYAQGRAEAWEALRNGTLKVHEVPEDAPGDSSGFTGKTYDEAVAYMKKMGVPSANASTIMTASEWTRRKNAGASNAAVQNYDSYEEYLADYVAYAIETYG